ncbi:MAG: bile acid:sodium symporter [Candidatus Pseudobacter hemicellulosilyticus]|uniref:Bile acid:sodium symporter n=1 Tax=Candidatus Pseudobacter hemicellulosilyticus TaxID=3121375 RepID=A0AAJ5WTZ0_9BACT|nr:MAG: bile acid:sodium symporter [Pseudobacter sp.]
MKIDRFVIAIVISIVLAYFFPQLGSRDSKVPLDSISSGGIMIVFLLYGMKLSLPELRSGLANWRMHVLVQFITFLVFPVLVLPFYPLVHTPQQELLWISVLFLAALPSTVSSSVVMVSMAKGNVPAAIFNASISGIIGIVITPLWMRLFLQDSGGLSDSGAIYQSLLIELVLPLTVGLLLQPFFGKWVKRNLKVLSLFDKGVILLIIYKSFVHSFEDNLFSSVGPVLFGGLVVIVLVLFYTVYALSGFFARRLGFNREDEISTRFCGTKKSLMHGTVFSKALFANSGNMGLILLPLMLFHALQILIVSVKATKMAKEVRE